MMLHNERIINTCLIILAVGLLIFFAFSVRLGRAADNVAILQTSGMTCGSCTDKITRALRSEPGVTAVKVDLAAGEVTVGYDSKQVAAEKLAAAVTAVGYRSSLTRVVPIAEYQSRYGSESLPGSKKSGCACCVQK